MHRLVKSSLFNNGNSIRHYSERVKHLGENVFAEFSQLARLHDAVNLGQGFPTFGTPKFLKEASMKAIDEENNQYTRPGGHPDFVEVLGSLYSKKFNRLIDPMKEIVTFNGAQEGIVSIFSALLNPEDEVLLMEPFFDVYVNAARILDVKPVGIPLEMDAQAKETFTNEKDDKSRTVTSKSLKLDLNRLEKCITPKTKMIVLNTPHNPTGKVFSRQELVDLCHLLKKYPQITILSDEVYEFMVYDGLKHERIATLPDMYDRVISLYSAGKTFSCTGWRVGATPLEVAVGKAFQKAQEIGYFDQLGNLLMNKRNQLIGALNESSLRYIVPEGGYFILADTSNSKYSQRFKQDTVDFHNFKSLPDYKMCELLTKEVGLTAIPLSPFYSVHNRHLAGNWIRLAFCKDDETLEAASKILSQL